MALRAEGNTLRGLAKYTTHGRTAYTFLLPSLLNLRGWMMVHPRLMKQGYTDLVLFCPLLILYLKALEGGGRLTDTFSPHPNDGELTEPTLSGNELQYLQIAFLALAKTDNPTIVFSSSVDRLYSCVLRLPNSS